MLAEYARTIKEQLQTGIIESVVELEGSKDIHYLPRREVVRKDAVTKKVRVVYDASSKEGKNGTSLNDCLHVAPSLNPLLFDILLKFRSHNIALVGNIEKALEDRDSLRFLWMRDPMREDPEIGSIVCQEDGRRVLCG